MEQLKPGISILVSTSQQPIQTELCLQALVEQNVAPFSFEVFVCDDGPEDLRNLVAQFSSKLDIEYIPRYPRTLDFRKAETLNLGLRLCSFERTLCIDGDVIVSPETVAKHAEYGDKLICLSGNRRHVDMSDVQELDERVEGGEQVYTVAQQLCHPDLTRHFDARLRKFVINNHGTSNSLNRSCPRIWLSSFQLSYPTAPAKAIGGYWEEFVGWGCEETEFLLRLERFGCTFDMNLELECFHLDHPSVRNDVEYPENTRLLQTAEQSDILVRNNGPM